MEFAYTPRLAELKDRARVLTEKIMPFEDECESNNGLSRRIARLDQGLGPGVRPAGDQHPHRIRRCRA